MQQTAKQNFLFFGDYSIYNKLKKEGIQDPTEYITFHGMRNWSVLMGKLVQEIIYVHSKLIIVDDKYVICGSANINDRSIFLNIKVISRNISWIARNRCTIINI